MFSMDKIWKVMSTFVHITLFVPVVTYGSPCTQRCLNQHGNVINCKLVSPSQLIRTQHSISSQLQCFDVCIKEPGCEFYNFRNQAGNDKSCELFRGLWSFEDESKLVLETGSIFTWIARDRYIQWLSPDCPGQECSQASNSSLIGSCKKALDIAFLIDTSVFNKDSLTLEKQFVSKVLQRFEQSSGYTKAAIIEYSTYPVVTFSFNNFTTPSHFTNHLQNISFVDGQTRYDRALDLSQSALFANEGGARPFAHRVVVLFTNNEIAVDADGVHSLPDLKASLKNKCIQTFAVGIDASGKSAASAVADSSEGHLLLVDYFSHLEAQANGFSNKICAALE